MTYDEGKLEQIARREDYETYFWLRKQKTTELTNKNNMTGVAELKSRLLRRKITNIFDKPMAEPNLLDSAETKKSAQK